jgi:inhibitor of cysteine peptidase
MSDIEVRQNGASLSVSRADRILLELPETPTTGYQWRIAQLPDSLEVVSDDFEPPASLAPGAGGLHRFVFAARRSGRGTASLKLQRPWETGDGAADEFRFDVVVA